FERWQLLLSDRDADPELIGALLTTLRMFLRFACVDRVRLAILLEYCIELRQLAAGSLDHHVECACLPDKLLWLPNGDLGAFHPPGPDPRSSQPDDSENDDNQQQFQQYAHPSDHSATERRNVGLRRNGRPVCGQTNLMLSDGCGSLTDERGHCQTNV